MTEAPHPLLEPAGKESFRIGRFIDLTGQRFGRYVVDGVAGRIEGKAAFWCVCDCGARKAVRSWCLRSGGTVSCGCHHLEQIKSGDSNRKHGLAHSYIWVIYHDMTRRCRDPRRKAYPDYGGRGITVCDRWLNGDGHLAGVACFAADMGDRPTPQHTLDRENNNGNYEPGNCRWVVDLVQMNNKRNNRFVEARGQRMTLAQWSRELGVPYWRLANRVKRKWSDDRIINQPFRRSPCKVA